MEQAKNQYIPGTCNIGPAEIRRRRQSGWAGFILGIVLWGVFVWIDSAPAWRLLVFLPAVMSATGFIQAYTHFCARFGFASLFNFGDVGKTDSVQQAEFRAQDRRKAWRIVVYSMLIGIGFALLAYFIEL